MLTKRIIPCLDVDRGRVVKGVKFFDHVDAGDPVEQARRYQDDGADELVFYDITASHEGRQIMADVVSHVVEEIFMPLTVGGGIRTLDDATRLIQAGAEKVSLNSAAIDRPDLIAEVSGKFGRCATVVNIDPRRVERDGRVVWEVHRRGGRVPTGLEAVAWARRVINRPDAAADRQGHEDLLDNLAHEVGHDLAPLVAGGDVVEDELVGAIVLVPAGLLDGVAGVDVVKELDALDHPPAVDVEAGDDALGEHRSRVASCEVASYQSSLATNNWQLATLERVTDGARTRDVQDHNLALYQLSYGHR